MSGYIRREDVLGIISSGWSNHYSCKDMCDEIIELPTLDEKEIIRKAFERVVKRICDVRNNTPSTDFKNGCNASLHQIHREIDIDVKERGINE